MDILNFAKEHQDILIAAIGFIIGLVLPKAKANLIGKTVGQKIPKKLAVIIADQLDAVEKGLRQQDVNGNTNLITNEQVSEKFKDLKVNLGLDQASKGKISL